MKAFSLTHNFDSISIRTTTLLIISCLVFGLSSATMVASTNTSTTTSLVVGASGATGKWVVKLLLDQGQNVKVIVRSKDRMQTLLSEMTTENDGGRLEMTEAALLDLSDAELQQHVQGLDAVVSCLGHNMDFKGIWGHPRKLVTDATKRLTAAIQATNPSKKTKFILMGSDGVANPNGKDDKRTFGERLALGILRWLIPPHADNEAAAAHVHSLGTNTENLQWTVVRPTDLIDGEPTGKFQLFEKPVGGLFGAGTATRANVAQCMVNYILDDDKFNQYKFQMPVIHDITPEQKGEEL